MADSGGSLTILPNGELGLCEHYSEDNFVGSLDGKASERSVIQSFREYWEPIEECKTCFYYPECIRLKKCAEQKECFEELRAEYKEYLLKSIIDRSPSSYCRAVRTALCKPTSGTAADSVYAAASKGSNAI